MSSVGRAGRSVKLPSHADIVAVKGDSKVLDMFDKYIRAEKYMRSKYKKKEGPKGVPGQAANGFDFNDFKDKIELTKDAADVMKYSTVFLNRLKFLIERKKYERAKKIYEHMYVKGCRLKFGEFATSTKRKFSIGEWDNFLKSKDQFIKFADRYYDFFHKASKYMGYVEKTVKTGEVVYLLYKLGNSVERVRHMQKAKMSPKELRDEFEKSYNAMKDVIEIGGKLAKLAPVGISDYVDMAVDVFKGAGTAVQLAKQRAEKLEKELENIQKLEKQHMNPYSKARMENRFNSTESSERTLNQRFKILDQQNYKQ